MLKMPQTHHANHRNKPMRTKKVTVHYCDHCSKRKFTVPAMVKHEIGCTMNPNRVCGMCKMLAEEGGPEPAPPRDELVRIMDADGFAAMCKAAEDCPACILAALRTKLFGFSWHVDHVLPLQGKKVSGLHVPSNLQVIPWADNVSKSNKFLL